jgi:hypothetical protein
MKTFFFLTYLLCSFSCKPVFSQQPAVFYRADIKILYKYSLIGDTLTITQTFLDSPYYYRGMQKELLVKKEIEGNFETWYLKFLSGIDVSPDNYGVLLVNNTDSIIGIFPWGNLGGTPTLELSEYAFLPKPTNILYFDCYPQRRYDSLRTLPSFANANETEAKSFFADLKKQSENFKQQNPNLIHYGMVAYYNFWGKILAAHHFNPFTGPKATNDIMVKYHIK